jgi:N-acyl-phosphatidylethanolamine-hydrolysing phospholipase D
LHAVLARRARRRFLFTMPTPDATPSATATRAHHRPGGGFQNPWPGSERSGIGGLLRWMLLERRGVPSAPDPALVATAYPRATPSFVTPRAPADVLTATWIGHSSFLVQIGGWNVLLDPVFGERASPVPFAGPRRFTAPGLALPALPPLDLVLHSHDHYDHLDAPTVRALAAAHPQARWLAPLGVGDTLASLGAPAVQEADWGDTLDLGPVRVACVPAQHFSGRGLSNRDASLWCGWTLHGRHASPALTPGVLYAGDTGLHPEFAAIARARGPFALALLPIGAYAPRWFMRPVHCDPDDALAAYTAVAAAQAESHPTSPPPVFGGMHFGTFVLTDEPVDEPPRRIRAAWAAAGRDAAQLWVPRHGETWAGARTARPDTTGRILRAG